MELNVSQSVPIKKIFLFSPAFKGQLNKSELNKCFRAISKSQLFEQSP